MKNETEDIRKCILEFSRDCLKGKPYTITESGDKMVAVIGPKHFMAELEPTEDVLNIVLELNHLSVALDAQKTKRR